MSQRSSATSALFVHIGGAERRAVFFDGMWPGAAVIDDPRRVLYQAFGLNINHTSVKNVVGSDGSLIDCTGNIPELMP